MTDPHCPEPLRDLIIIGAGGWGREVLALLQADPDHGKAWAIKGFLDSRTHILNGLGYEATPVLGDPLAYVPQPQDLFVCALGDPRQRERYARPLQEAGGQFLCIRAHALLGDRVQFGQGCLFSRLTQISPDVRIGDFVHIQTLTIVGHDTRIGDYAQIGAMVFIGGGVRIGRYAVVHPHATITPGIQVGEGATVGAGAVVVKDVAPHTTVFGNPARAIFHSPSI
jgi:sugar O-acyltransferase (sialic acid O-acetyltransferase NeuD family)